MWTFPAASLPFHAVMHNGIDPAFDGAATNRIPFSPQARIIHVLFASLKVRRRIPNIFQASDPIPIQNLQGGHHLFHASMPQEANLSLRPLLCLWRAFAESGFGNITQSSVCMRPINRVDNMRVVRGSDAVDPDSTIVCRAKSHATFHLSPRA